MLSAKMKSVEAIATEFSPENALLNRRCLSQASCEFTLSSSGPRDDCQSWSTIALDRNGIVIRKAHF
jgi:hypothetical protein